MSPETLPERDDRVSLLPDTDTEVRLPAPSDTTAAAERFLIDGYRRMPAGAKLQRVAAMNRALEQLARARLRARYGADLSERELRLRLGALRLDADVMRTVFDWDPRVHGL